MLILILLLTTGYLGYLLWEKQANDRALKSFRYIVLTHNLKQQAFRLRL